MYTNMKYSAITTYSIIGEIAIINGIKNIKIGYPKNWEINRNNCNDAKNLIKNLYFLRYEEIAKM
ncbi:hypothetical protein HS5_17450 [Acidianus sp. HS-5]|nr:hypothetical protein HS5_17450 [Acidianus sp. HS-5]